jgi:hypothetical protein
MSDIAMAGPRPAEPASALLKGAGALWFLVAVAGQWLFAYYIAAHYMPPTVSGNFAAWDEAGLIHGYTAGDLAGNLGFISHVLLAAVITVGGTLQLIEPLRRRLPRLHRWTGRLYIPIAVFMAVGGLALVWIRGTRLNDIVAMGITLNALLILLAAGLALHFALKRQIDRHRRWAMRLFVLVSGVWFMRVGYMAWGMTTGGAGIGEAMGGPFDYFLAFGCYLVPLAIVELYMRARDSHPAPVKLAMAGVTTLAAGVTAIGVFGAWLVMWSPHV